MKRFLFFIVIVYILTTLYLFIPFKSNNLLFFPKKDNPYFNIILLHQDIPLNNLDAIILKHFNVKKGWIRSDTLLNKYDIFRLATATKHEKTRKMVLFGGETITEFAKKIAKQAKLDRKKILQIYKNKAPFSEASILASSYNIPYKTNESATISYMLAKSYAIFSEYAKAKKIKFPSKEFKRYLIIASIIEKETSNINEMPLIASVIYNRLKKGLKLQMDATLNYKQYAHRIITPKIIRNDNTHYNSYKYKGLPPEPLGAVSIEALEAAFFPAKSNYLYFVKKGRHHIFSSNYQEHKKRVIEYKKRLHFKQKLFSKIKQTLKITYFIAPGVIKPSLLK